MRMRENIPYRDHTGTSSDLLRGGLRVLASSGAGRAGRAEGQGLAVRAPIGRAVVLTQSSHLDGRPAARTGPAVTPVHRQPAGHPGSSDPRSGPQVGPQQLVGLTVEGLTAFLVETPQGQFGSQALPPQQLAFVHVAQTGGHPLIEEHIEQRASGILAVESAGPGVSWPAGPGRGPTSRGASKRTTVRPTKTGARRAANRHTVSPSGTGLSLLLVSTLPTDPPMRRGPGPPASGTVAR